MVEKSYYDKIPEDSKKDIAFNIVAAVREAIDIANKKAGPPTYEQTLQILHDIEPNLYEFCNEQLKNKNENEMARLFKERAAVETLKEGRIITPEDLLEKEIKNYAELRNQEGIDRENKQSIKRHIISLEAALESMKPRRLSEHRVLERDFKVERSHLGAEPFKESDDYVDYRLAKNRFLRIRMLHPDQAEHILGADLIYERYNKNTDNVRIAVLQYKVWNDNNVLYFSNADDRNLGQMKKLHKHLCEHDLCAQGEKEIGSLDYRFPYCCAFLRPTDRMQDPNSKMISSGVHIPICSAIEMAERDKKIVKDEIRHSALTHDVFEYLFNHGFIGSRAMPCDKMEEFYKDLEVFEGSRTIKVYAKEVIEVPSK